MAQQKEVHTIILRREPAAECAPDDGGGSGNARRPRQSSSSTSFSTITPSSNGGGSSSRSHSPVPENKQKEGMNDKLTSPQSKRKIERTPAVVPNKDTKKKKTKESTNSSASDSEMDELEKIFEAEAIIGRKIVKGQVLWRVRWVDYGSDDDTWEPTENLLGDNVQSMMREYEANEEEKKMKRKELTRRSLDYKKQRQLEEAAEEKASSKDEVAIEKQENDKTEEGAEAEEDPNGSNVEGWFGIKPDEGTREQRRLFVHDRRLSKTEKLLAFASPGIRVLRNHLRVQTDEGSSNISTSAAKSSLEQKQTRGRPSKRKIKIESDLESEPSTIRKVVPKRAIKREKKSRPSKSQSPLNKKSEVETLKEIKQLQEAGSSGQIAESKATVVKKQAEKDELGKDLKKLVKKIPVSERHSSLAATKEKAKVSENKSQKPSTSSSIGVIAGVEFPVKTLAEGTNILNEKEKILKKLQTNKADIREVSQQEFEEIVMDGKAENVRSVLFLNARDPFLDLNKTDDFGKTLIHRLCEIRCKVTNTQCELIALLASHGARLDVCENNLGQIPLHIAIANRRLCLVRKLLSLHTPINMDDRMGNSPIVLAMECSSDYDYLKFLLKAGSSFHLALEKGYRDQERYKRQLRIITEHETLLRRALNSARDNVTINMTVKCISPIFVNPLYEGETILQQFNLSTQPQLPDKQSAYMLFVGVADFRTEDNDRDGSPCLIQARMWGKSPVANASMNGKECAPVKQGNNNFAFLCVPCRDKNQLKMQIVPGMQESEMKLLSQIVLVQFHTQQSNSTRPAPVHPLPSSMRK